MATTWLHNFHGSYGQKYAKLEYTLGARDDRHNLKNPELCWCEPRRMEFIEGEGWKEVEEGMHGEDSAEDKEDKEG